MYRCTGAHEHEAGVGDIGDIGDICGTGLKTNFAWCMVPRRHTLSLLAAAAAVKLLPSPISVSAPGPRCIYSITIA